MDDELRQAFATLSAQMADVGNDARSAAALSRETAHEMVKVARKVDGLEADVGQLKAKVFGSNPPPAPPVPLSQRITHSEGELAELAGQMIAVKAELATVKEINEAQTKKIDSIHKAVVGVVTNPRVVFVGKVLFGAAMAYAAAKGFKVVP